MSKNNFPNNNKGFTLIELLLVISIISLLSSIVLASLSNVREKAIVTKAVAELKSLQTAIAQYQLQNGIVPYEMVSGVTYFGTNPYAWFEDQAGSFNFINYFQVLITSNKYISKIPQSPTFPKNGTSYYFGYMTANASYTRTAWPGTDKVWYCGDNPVTKYMIYFYSNNIKIDLPIATYINYKINSTTKWGMKSNLIVSQSTANSVYCIGE